MRHTAPKEEMGTSNKHISLKFPQNDFFQSEEDKKISAKVFVFPIFYCALLFKKTNKNKNKNEQTNKKRKIQTNKNKQTKSPLLK